MSAAVIADKSTRERAKQIYLTMTPARFDKIAERVGATKEQVKQWHQEDGWLEALRSVKERKAEELKLLKATTRETLLDHLATGRTILETIRFQLARNRKGYRKAIDQLPLPDLILAYRSVADVVLRACKEVGALDSE
jgi:hypothetical protein